MKTLQLIGLAILFLTSCEKEQILQEVPESSFTHQFIFDDEAKQFIIDHAKISVNNCSGQIHLLMITNEGGSDHMWTVNMNMTSSPHPCIDYYWNGVVR